MARHQVPAGPSLHGCAHHVALRADRPDAKVGAAPGVQSGAWMGEHGGRLHARAYADGRYAGSGVGACDAEAWGLLTTLPSPQVDAAWDVWCRWDEAGVRHSTAMG